MLAESSLDSSAWPDRAANDIDCVPVGREEFCQLLVSRRPLARENDPSTGTLGLLDVDTHQLFVIPERELFPDTHFRAASLSGDLPRAAR